MAASDVVASPFFFLSQDLFRHYVGNVALSRYTTLKVYNYTTLKVYNSQGIQLSRVNPQV